METVCLNNQDCESDSKMESQNCFPNTREALTSLQSLLQCRICCKNCRELFTLGNCEHRFCRDCAKENVGNLCPVCEMPSQATQAHGDKQLSIIASLCADMLSLIDGKGLAHQTEPTVVEPKQGSSLIQISGSRKRKLTPKALAATLSPDEDSPKKRKKIALTRIPKLGGARLSSSFAIHSCKNSPKAKLKCSPAKNMKKRSKSMSPQCHGLIEKQETLCDVANTSFNSSFNRGKKKRNLIKKNAKGETPLQVATIKNNVDKVRELLEEGASPNVKDNAGWTPLHEAVNRGYLAIAELLVKYGASVNAPGLDNDTPLHDAVSNHRMACVQLLLKSGCNVTTRNTHGLTAIDMAQTEEMRNELIAAKKSPVPNNEAIQVQQLEEAENDLPLCFVGTGLSRREKASLHNCAKVLDARMQDDFSSEVTHLITGVNLEGNCSRTLKYLTAIVTGKWIVSAEWMNMCVQYKRKVSEEAFEVSGCVNNPNVLAAQKARLNRLRQLPRLFDGCQLYFHGKFTAPSPSREELATLVKLGGGIILTREPRLYNLDDYPYTVPFHASPVSSLADCSIYVIYDDACARPPTVDAQRMTCLPVSWFMDSIASFTLLEKSDYVGQ